MVLNNLSENLIPYVKYRYTKYNALKKHGRRLLDDKSKQHMQRIEKEYMRPSYTASIGNGLEDGLFDDFLELALQFGMVTMFACTFPFIFVFAAANNFIEIRTDSLKLLGMLRRPVPRAVSTIGAWLNIFQFLAGMAICTNCALLVCFYDQEERWKIEPGLAAILLMEHVLLLIKFGIACLVPEEPTWVRANRMRHAQARDSCSQQLLENICKPEKKIC